MEPQETKDIASILAGTTNDELFNEYLGKLLMEQRAHSPEFLSRLTFSEGCTFIRHHFGVTARTWTKKDLRNMVALNRLSDRKLFQELCIGSDVIALSLVPIIMGISLMLKLGQVQKSENSDLPYVIMNILVLDNVRYHVMGKMVGFQRVAEMANWVNDVEARTRELNGILVRIEALPESMNSQSAIHVAKEFIEQFVRLQAAMFGTYRNKLANERL